ncbi:MAG: hypothetical protein IKN38_07785 [Clostridia bacterium]|nr:hypothetical protein [Clostridia bacterium]
MATKRISNDDIRDEMSRAIATRCASDFARKIAASSFIRARAYLSFFSLVSCGDTSLTLRIATVNSRGHLVKLDKLTGADVALLLEKPKAAETAALRENGKQIVMALSAPKGYKIQEAFRYAEAAFFALKKVELYDFLLIDRGVMYSLVRSTLEALGG